MNKETKYVYPKLSGVDLGLIRIKGNGLAHCLFIYARAILFAHQNNCKIIMPTWAKFVLSPYLRGDIDKRHYLHIFKSKSEISGLRELFLINSRSTHVIDKIAPFFEDLLDDSVYISKYIQEHLNPDVLHKLEEVSFNNCVACYVKLGDNTSNLRTPLDWYKKQIQNCLSKGYDKVFIFSDCADSELSELIEDGNGKYERAFYGNAIADIFAMSKCSYLIGSDSIFSGWAVYLGQVSCIFYSKHYGSVLQCSENEKVVLEHDLWRWN